MALEQQFNHIYKTNYSLVVNKIIQIIHDRAVAEELAQNVFINLYNSDWKEIENMPAWLRKTAMFTSYNYIRSEKREYERMRKEFNSMNDQVSSSEEQFLQRDDISNVHVILNIMEERERQLLMMKYSGFSYKEVANSLNINEKSVGKLLSRARKKFKQLYEQQWGENCELL
ncbi:sigma-70 family RNA polymerase sigma factor [Bacillus sp. SM2101]|uniref:sigma-70 family RNA polymerase sigma factor n=1 Tax=Bacillus sp. SM2101 TaxID=2805366 RepID=UPI001BDF1D16